MVRAGEDFQVFDAKTGEDITRSVLTQIIFEQEAKGQNMLPTNFLRQLIRLYGDALQSVVPGYLEASMDLFARNQERMRNSFGANPAMASFEQLARSNIELLERTMQMFGSFGPQAQGDRGRARDAGQESAAEEDMEALQQKLREMEAQLRRLTEEEPESGKG
jgi:polyhydroxyalkanoate synthesis repressor PhaR